MAVNCWRLLEPKLVAIYFGDGIQSILTCTSAGNVLAKDLRWCAEQLNKDVLGHDNAMVRKHIGKWDQEPQCFPLGNFDGAMITMGSFPRFPMYDNDFGWGKTMAVQR
ncbi:unnamed protein product [Fraxinus pennsylvanica]|uniref:Uncharacterized protein n=1 Tax=Fraxinus pennsylvanica TaxID=56036 RepID=A0AAD2DSB5_9LAMI|nr:unnamed protein product [Fraxinus pennsylvanica]